MLHAHQQVPNYAPSTVWAVQVVHVYLNSKVVGCQSKTMNSKVSAPKKWRKPLTWVYIFCVFDTFHINKVILSTGNLKYWLVKPFTSFSQTFYLYDLLYSFTHWVTIMGQCNVLPLIIFCALCPSSYLKTNTDYWVVPKPGGGHIKRPGKDWAATVAVTERGRLAGWKKYKEQAEIIRPQWQTSPGRQGEGRDIEGQWKRRTAWRKERERETRAWDSVGPELVCKVSMAYIKLMIEMCCAELAAWLNHKILACPSEDSYSNWARERCLPSQLFSTSRLKTQHLHWPAFHKVHFLCPTKVLL